MNKVLEDKKNYYNTFGKENIYMITYINENVPNVISCVLTEKGFTAVHSGEIIENIIIMNRLLDLISYDSFNIEEYDDMLVVYIEEELYTVNAYIGYCMDKINTREIINGDMYTASDGNKTNIYTIDKFTINSEILPLANFLKKEDLQR